MTIAVTCGSCGRSVSAPPTAAGRKIRCSKCGNVTLVNADAPAAKPVAKICTDCGIDVAGRKRTKDTAGRYFCQPCWDARLARQRNKTPAAKEAPAPAKAPIAPAKSVESSEAVTCRACGRDVPPDDMTTDELGAAICWPCLNGAMSRWSWRRPHRQRQPRPPPLPTLPPTPATRNSTGGAASSNNAPPLKKLGLFVLGLGVLGYFGIWPMYQVTQHVPRISFSFKFIILGATLTPISLVSLIFGDDVMRWRKSKKDRSTALERIIMVLAVLGGFAFAGFVYYFFDSHGYTIKF